MKKHWNVLIAGVMASSLMVTMSGSVLAAETQETEGTTLETTQKREYDYENKYLWDVPADALNWDNYKTLADHDEKMGGPAADGTPFSMDDFINSPLGESVITAAKNFILYPDEYSQEEYDYWESLGIRKEMHDSEDKASKWATFTPEEAFAPENADKKYPVLFVFHGGNNPIYVTETWGYAQMAAEEGFICVMPWANNSGSKDEEEGTTLDSEMDRIMEVLRSDYPIDESRIYAAGYSLGGRSTVRESIKHPNLFAAITVGGHDLGGIRAGDTSYTFSEEEWDALEETPVLQIDGDNEMRIKLPYGYSVAEENSTNSLNRWFAIDGIDRTVTLEGCKEIADTAEDLAQRKLGLDADKIYTQYYDGTEYYTADFLNSDGVNMIKIINVEGMIHWMTPSMARVAWNFMSQYARNTETGEMIVLNQDNQPQTQPEEIDYNKKGTFIADYTKEAGRGEEIVITLKASDDVTDYEITDEEGKALEVTKEMQAGDEGYQNWVLTCSTQETGKIRLQLIPVCSGETKDALILPVLVQ